MKATQATFGRLAEQAARDARIFFFCGPDEAGATAAADRIVSLLPDPGERVEIGGADLRKDPVRLSDEARSNSLFGDTRHVWVRASGDEAHDALANLIADDVEACPVIIVATSATDKSRTAKLIANRPDALVGMFYPPDVRDITMTVRAMGDAAGVRLDAAQAERIARGSGLDVRLCRSEVEKLALYLDAAPESPKSADRLALDAVGARMEEDGYAPLVEVVLSGRTRELAGELRRMRELGLNPVSVLLAFERRAAQLAGLAARLGPAGNVGDFIKAEQKARRVFFRDAQQLSDQLSRWRGKRLERLVEKLADMHRNLMSRSQDAGLLLAQGLSEIARVASKTR